MLSRGVRPGLPPVGGGERAAAGAPVDPLDQIPGGDGLGRGCGRGDRSGGCRGRASQRRAGDDHGDPGGQGPPGGQTGAVVRRSRIGRGRVRRRSGSSSPLLFMNGSAAVRARRGRRESGRVTHTASSCRACSPGAGRRSYSPRLAARPEARVGAGRARRRVPALAGSGWLAGALDAGYEHACISSVDNVARRRRPDRDRDAAGPYPVPDGSR